jgi:PEP-CTERM motif
MRMLRLILSACLFVIIANTAFADSTPPDPRITMGGGGSCTETPFSENALTQSFTGLKTGCINDFQNDIFVDDGTPFDLTTLVVNVTSPFTGSISCAIVEGSPLTGTPTASASACTFVAAIESEESIRNGTIYGLEFDNLSGSFGSTVDITLSQNVIPTPEPPTILLFSVGLAGLLAGRKRLEVAGQASSSGVC